jgi:hypothetical protein
MRSRFLAHLGHGIFPEGVEEVPHVVRHSVVGGQELVQLLRGARRGRCGRGSAAASVVSYCLMITHVDPIRHDLFFE